MIRQKIIISIVSCSLLFVQGYAQHPGIDSLPVSANNPIQTPFLPIHKLHVGVQVGTEFMSSSGYGSGFSTYFSPTLTYPVSKRFILSGGISVVNTSLYGIKPYFSPSEVKPWSGNITQTTLWVSGQYMLNDRLTLSGTAYKTFDISGDKPGYYPYYKNKPQGAYFNVGYKISDNFHIDAGFGYSQGDNGYSFGYPENHGFGASSYNPLFNR